MNIVNICCYAYGYYSGSEYEEKIAIPEEAYEKVKNKIEELQVYIPELDGKHSEIEADIVIQFIEEKNVANVGLNEVSNDGEDLWNELSAIFADNGLDLMEETRKVEQYLETIDYFVDVTVRVKKSDVSKIREYEKKLNE